MKPDIKIVQNDPEPLTETPTAETPTAETPTEVEATGRSETVEEIQAPRPETRPQGFQPARQLGGIGSNQMVRHLRETQDVLLVPGSHVGLGNYLRIGFGDEPTELAGGLEALGAGLRSLVSD